MKQTSACANVGFELYICINYIIGFMQAHVSSKKVCNETIKMAGALYKFISLQEGSEVEGSH